MLDFATDGRLSHVMAAPAGYPTTTFIFAKQTSGANRMLFSEVEIAAGRRVRQWAFYEASGVGVSASSLTSWGSAPGASVSEDLSSGSVAKAVMVVRHSASSVTVYTTTSPAGTTNSDANALASEFAAADTLLVAAAYYDGAYGGYASGPLGEYARWHGVALNATNFAALAGLTVAPVAAETVQPSFLYDVWSGNPAGAAGSPVTGTLVGLVNGRVMTVTGTVTKSALTHPVTRAPVATLSGTATLDGLSASGSMAPQPNSSLSGTAALDGLAASGSMSQTPGTLTVPQLRNFMNTLLTSQLVANIAVLRIARPVVLLDVAQDITTHVSTGDLVHTSAALVPGTAVLVVGFNLEGSQRFARAVTIT